ncbi:MAG: single-stranded DNA-binding protein [Anaerolineales bacterium]|nr:single-stranded DNA-binding protein [Anaerolineales bacterium]
MFHKLILVGNLGRDPEMRYTPSGQAVTNLSVASNRQYTKSDGESVKETIWFRVSVWGKSAEACNEYLRKGRPVLVEGRLNPDESGNPRMWTSNDGQSRASFEVTAETVKFLGGRDDAPLDADQGQPAAAPESEDDIPF